MNDHALVLDLFVSTKSRYVRVCMRIVGDSLTLSHNISAGYGNGSFLCNLRTVLEMSEKNHSDYVMFMRRSRSMVG